MPVPNTKTERGYQEQMICDLVEYITAGHEVVLLSSPTGSGKTYMLRRVVADLIRAGVITGAAVAVPQDHIKDGWQDKSTAAGGASLRAYCHASITERWVRKHFKPGALLIIDEAHHAGEGVTRLGAAVAAWLKLGGRVIYATATAFRTDGAALPGLTDDTREVTRTLSEHMDGVYAPGKLEIGTITLAPYRLQSDEDDDAETDWPAVYRELVERWLRDGSPQAVFYLPRTAHAELAREALEAKGARVLDATGNAASDQRRVRSALSDEAKRTQTGRPSQYDVILSCKRFDEGSDWPWCSAVYMFGMPRAMWLIMQRIGRTLRAKGRLSDYPSEFANRSLVRFVLPFGEGIDPSEYIARHKDVLVQVMIMSVSPKRVLDFIPEGRTKTGRAAAQGIAADAEDPAIRAAIGEALEVLGKGATRSQVATYLSDRRHDEEFIGRAKRLLAFQANPEALKDAVRRADALDTPKGLPSRLVREEMQAVVDALPDSVAVRDPWHSDWQAARQAIGEVSKASADELSRAVLGGQATSDREMLKVLCEHYGQTGSFACTQDDDPRLRDWCSSVRKRRRRGCLPPWLDDCLTKLAFPWSPLDERWEASFRECLDRQTWQFAHGDPLRTWCSSQRSQRESLSPERVRRLTNAGFPWKPARSRRDQFVALLREVKRALGHLRLPVSTALGSKLENRKSDWRRRGESYVLHHDLTQLGVTLERDGSHSDKVLEGRRVKAEMERLVAEGKLPPEVL